MAGVPIVYRKGVKRDLVNYDYIDIATGQKYIILYCGDVQTGADANTPIMGVNVYYSQNGYTTFANPAVIDLDFDMPVDQTLEIRGDIILEIPNGSDQNNAGHLLSGAMFYVRSGSEVQIGDTDIGSTSANNTEDVTTIKITAPRTIVKKGDTLRMNINAGASPNTLTFFHDPKDRDLSALASIGAGWITSQMKVHLPLSLD